MEILFKITTWEKVKISPEIEDIILKGLEKGVITSSKDVFELDELADSYSAEELTECDKQISLNDNNGLSTIKVMKNNKIIFENGK